MMKMVLRKVGGVFKNQDPTNPYSPGSIKSSLYEDDFSDLKNSQIAEVLGCARSTVDKYVLQIERETGKIPNTLAAAKRIEREENHNGDSE